MPVVYGQSIIPATFTIMGEYGQPGIIVTDSIDDGLKFNRPPEGLNDLFEAQYKGYNIKLSGHSDLELCYTPLTTYWYIESINFTGTENFDSVSLEHTFTIKFVELGDL